MGMSFILLQARICERSGECWLPAEVCAIAQFQVFNAAAVMVAAFARHSAAGAANYTITEVVLSVSFMLTAAFNVYSGRAVIVRRCQPYDTIRATSEMSAVCRIAHLTQHGCMPLLPANHVPDSVQLSAHSAGETALLH
jgi:hypothetical protein